MTNATLNEFAYDHTVMLMRVDPDVHFHLTPRYAHERRFAEAVFRDASRANDLDDATGAPRAASALKLGMIPLRPEVTGL